MSLFQCMQIKIHRHNEPLDNKPRTNCELVQHHPAIFTSDFPDRNDSNVYVQGTG
jgi:hypothetical protein